MRRDGILEHVRKITPHFQERLQALARFPLVGDVRGKGLLGCVDCVVTASDQDALELDKSVGVMVDAYCQENGLILRPIVNMCVFSPPLIINDSQIDQMFDIIEKGIMQTTDELVRRDVNLV